MNLHRSEETLPSQLYAAVLQGFEASLVEMFLVEVYRYKHFQFTSSIKSTIRTYLAHTCETDTGSNSRLS